MLKFSPTKFSLTSSKLTRDSFNFDIYISSKSVEELAWWGVGICELGAGGWSELLVIDLEGGTPLFGLIGYLSLNRVGVWDPES